MIFAVHLNVQMAGKENKAKSLLEKYITDDLGIKAVHHFEEFDHHITETRKTVRCKSKIPGYIFIEMDADFIRNSNEDRHSNGMLAKTWYFLKKILCAFYIDVLNCQIKREELEKFFEVEEVEKVENVVFSINKEEEELIEIAEEEERTCTLGKKFTDVFCVAIKKAISLSTKGGRTRLTIPVDWWKKAYSFFDPSGKKNKESFLHNHTYLPYLITVIQGSV